MNDFVKPKKTSVAAASPLFSPNFKPQLNKPTKAIKSKSIKTTLYSQVNASARPLDRIRRPAPKHHSQTDLTDLIKDLNFSFKDEFNKKDSTVPVTVAATANTQPVQRQFDWAQKTKVVQTNTKRPLSRPQLAHHDTVAKVDFVQRQQAYASRATPARLPAYRMTHRRKLVGGALILSTALALFFIGRAMNGSGMSAADVQWQEDRRQYNCALRQYQMDQGMTINNNQSKELSCPN